MRTNFAALPARHLVHQGKVAASMGNTAVQALLQRFLPRSPPPLVLPGKEVAARVLPRSPALVRDYVRHVGGDPAAYARTIPPHMFPQWSVPLAAQTLEGLPYPAMLFHNGRLRAQNAPAADWRANLDVQALARDSWRRGELTAPPGGEEDADVLERFDAALARALARAGRGVVGIVTHHGMLRIVATRAGVDVHSLIPNLGGFWFDVAGGALINPELLE